MIARRRLQPWNCLVGSCYASGCLAQVLRRSALLAGSVACHPPLRFSLRETRSMTQQSSINNACTRDCHHTGAGGHHGGRAVGASLRPDAHYRPELLQSLSFDLVRLARMPSMLSTADRQSRIRILPQRDQRRGKRQAQHRQQQDGENLPHLRLVKHSLARSASASANHSPLTHPPIQQWAG
jgi:hypothetical protein